jgi:hypothetical protein
MSETSSNSEETAKKKGSIWITIEGEVYQIRLRSRSLKLHALKRQIAQISGMHPCEQEIFINGETPSEDLDVDSIFEVIVNSSEKHPLTKRWRFDPYVPTFLHVLSS